MLGSVSHYFEQDKRALAKGFADVAEYLRIKGYSLECRLIYLKAFDYFCENPHDFDGATAVKDLCDLPDLDLDAMLHDFHYINYNVGSSVSMKWRADKLYALGNERKGKSEYASWSRFVGLSLVGIGFIPFARIKRCKMSDSQKEMFMSDYKILIK